MSRFTGFEHDRSAKEALIRLEGLAGRELRDFFGTTLADAPHPEAAIVNLERWLKASTHPDTQLGFLLEAPRLARLILILLGSSQPLADALVQNPELGAAISDPSYLDQFPTVERVKDEGSRLLAASTSYSHALDRLRFLRQTWMIRLALNDLAGSWPQPKVWEAISNLAESIVDLARQVVWREYASMKGVEGACPVSIIAFGKLGGQELNYSSDIDLVYVCGDALDEAVEKHATRFAEMLNRALVDPMGRGSLYRVDLRLRPYGRSGPLVCSMRSVEAYYRSYAEEWEYQALLRSKMISGEREIEDRWELLRNENVFRPKLTSSSIEAMLSMRRRIEEKSSDSDLKRGSGGIRDVEFYVQILQRMHGYSHPSVKVRPTIPAIQALVSEGFLSNQIGKELSESYTFLRKLEHRLQIGDRQTHEVPEDDEQRERLAHLMGLADWHSLEVEWTREREFVRSKYSELERLDHIAERSQRDIVLEKFEADRDKVEHWFDLLPESNLFYDVLAENADSVTRVQQILFRAPILIQHLMSSVSLTEAILSGEVEEELDIQSQLHQATSRKHLAKVARSLWVKIVAQAALDESAMLALTERFSIWNDGILEWLSRQRSERVDVVGLGSYGSKDMNIGSDCDVLLLTERKEDIERAETAAQELLGWIQELRSEGVDIEIDLRLRPEGRKGYLVRTYEGFELYELASMEMWERLALGQSRLVCGKPSAHEIVLEAAYALPLTPERLQELLSMKLRIETERVAKKHARRDVKLGIGGLSDIEWLVRLHEMRYPTASEAGQHVTFDDRIKMLNKARLLNAFESDALRDARRYLSRVRSTLSMLGFTPNVIPENPDKLDRLGHVFGYTDGNAFLAHHESVIENVRAIYNEGIERLRA